MKQRVISVTEFKAKCLALLDGIEESGAITITKRGRPLATVGPARQPAWKSPEGAWAGKVTIAPDLHNRDTSSRWEVVRRRPGEPGLTPRFLLDTHIVVWWLAAPQKLSKEQRRVLREAVLRHEPAAVSAITLLEIAVLFGKAAPAAISRSANFSARWIPVRLFRFSP